MRYLGMLLLVLSVWLPMSAHAADVECQCMWGDESTTGNGSCASSTVEDFCRFDTPIYDQSAWNDRVARLETILESKLNATFLPVGIGFSTAQRMAETDPAGLIDSLLVMAFVTDSTLADKYRRESFTSLSGYLRRNASLAAAAFVGGEPIEYNRPIGYGVRKGCFHIRSAITIEDFSFMFRTDWADFDKEWTCVGTD